MDDDDELQQIQQRRLQELQRMQGGGASSPEAQQQEAERKSRMEEARKQMVNQVLTPDARERLARIALVKPDKARAVEEIILSAAQRGQLTAKVDEPKLISLLEQLGEQKKETKVTIQRKNRLDDDD